MINESLQLQILTLRKNGLSYGEIGLRLRVARSTVQSVCNKNRMPEHAKKNINFSKLMSTQLFCFCEDMELLTKRLAIEVLYQKPDVIVVSKRLNKTIKKEKLNKIVSILNKVNLKCEVKYA